MSNDSPVFKGFKYLAPFLLSVFLILLNALPVYPLIGMMNAVPVVLVVIFYFAVFNPMLLNIYMVFILSLFADILVTSPFGLLVITYVLMFFLGNFLRTYLFNLTFKKLWGVFIIFSGCVLGIQYLLACLFLGRWMPLISCLISWAVLILIYPFIISLCAKLDHCAREVA